jgi:hypothetical protein
MNHTDSRVHEWNSSICDLVRALLPDSLSLSFPLFRSSSISLCAQVHNELWRRGLILCDPEQGEERCDMIRLVLAKERSVELDDVPVVEVTIS